MNAVELLKQVLLRSGADWVLWLLAALGVVVLVVSLERWRFFALRAGDTQRLAFVLEEHLLRVPPHGDAGGPAWPHDGRALGARVVDAGLAMMEHGPEAAGQAMQSRAALERELLERRLTVLGTIGNNAPFVGLLGTVIGVVHAFEELGRAAAVGQQQSASVMAGIAEALVATAVGLVVAIPAVALYNAFHRRLASLVASTEVLSRLLLAHIALRAPGAPPRPPGARVYGPERSLGAARWSAPVREAA